MKRWVPQGHQPSFTLEPGVYQALLTGARFGRTSKRGLPMLTLQLTIEERDMTFALVWGAHPIVDQRSSEIVERLHEMADLPLEEDPNWEILVTLLEGREFPVVITQSRKTQELYLESILSRKQPAGVRPPRHSTQLLSNWKDDVPDERGDD